MSRSPEAGVGILGGDESFARRVYFVEVDGFAPRAARSSLANGAIGIPPWITHSRCGQMVFSGGAGPPVLPAWPRTACGQEQDPVGNSGNQRDVAVKGSFDGGLDLGRPVVHLRDVRPWLVEMPLCPPRKVKRGDGAQIRLRGESRSCPPQSG
jgi:hypothetical protein